MDWTWINELLQNIEVFEIITTLIGLSGFTFGIAVWDAIKKGKESRTMYNEFEVEGWTTEEKNKYVAKTGEFWDSVDNIFDIVINLFKKKK